MAPIANDVGLATAWIRTRGQTDLLLSLSLLHTSPPTLVFYHPLTESLPKNGTMIVSFQHNTPIVLVQLYQAVEHIYHHANYQ
jgi:hypothetical protein